MAGPLSNELLILIESTAGEFVHPAKRIACGGQIRQDHPEEVAAAILRGLGVGGAEARGLVKVPLPAIRRALSLPRFAGAARRRFRPAVAARCA